MRLGLRGLGAVALLGMALIPACFVGKTTNIGSEDPEGSGGAPNCATGETRPPTVDEGFCNTCRCVGGDWECSTNSCPDDPSPRICAPGAMRPATEAEGLCNTCFCSGHGFWQCTNRVCNDACTPGSMRPADDDCNTCTCDESGQNWVCSETTCPTCEPGTQIPAGDGCNTCACTAEGTRGECSILGCPICRVGEQRPAGDGCNTCTCMDAFSWSCTMRLCTCEPGTTIPSLDGCNFCTCDQNGEFDCTGRTCGTCDASPTREACVREPRYAFDPDTLTCCFYNDACHAPAGWTQYANFTDCMDFDPPCAQGYADCNGQQDDGCETNVETDATHCGRCDFECPTPINGTAFCAAGACNIVCDAGWMNCNMSTDDGCETAGTDCSAF